MKQNDKMKKAFTLAEVMITLTVIGVIAAVSLPVAMRSKPDENIMKFKKAHATLYRVIGELVSSDKYYCDGDLGSCRPNCSCFGKATKYFCNSIVDLLAVKSQNCTSSISYPDIRKGIHLISNEYPNDIVNGDESQVRNVTTETISQSKTIFDDYCKSTATKEYNKILTTDGVVYYETSNSWNFSTETIGSYTTYRAFSAPNASKPKFADQDGMDIAYKIFCIDVDGIPNNATTSNCKNECPFGYGIRADGKILPGKRAEEWIKKTMTEDK